MAFREQPVANRFVAEKWQDRQYRLHRRQLQSIRPSIDNTAPKSMPHMFRNPKKAQMEADRQDRIMRDNKTLYKRMTLIMQKSSLDNKLTTPAPGGGRVRSLNSDLRRQQDVQITRENQALLKRIRSRQPVYNHLEWEQDRAKHEERVSRMSRFQPRYRTGGEGDYVYAEGADQVPQGTAGPAATGAGEEG
eukprot:TRINITY_DN73471_c0_g1_i1.p1 TRINITY_DN73471_c0_g1~~TRINITY_DN73471_c0_g1_i1.p1  ORF type:complete len:191 (-),score=19.76 TRINITY_DN73471_c0_g1_i1:113-685(-)